MVEPALRYFYDGLNRSAVRWGISATNDNHLKTIRIIATCFYHALLILFIEERIEINALRTTPTARPFDD